MIHIKIQANGEEKISVTLSKNDMSEFDITYDELDYSNIETRRVIWTILDEAKRVLGKPINIDNRLLIQVAPADDGGCFLEFTQLPELSDSRKKRLIMKKEAEPLLFKGFDINSFIDGIRILKSGDFSSENCEIYKFESSLCAVIQPKIGFTEKFLFILGEFGEIISPKKIELSKIYEYGEKIDLP